MKRARKVSRWLRSRLAKGALILGYHRVADVAYDPYQICVTPRNFAEQLQVLQRVANPISLAELHRSLTGENIPHRAIVVTIDDGYADVCHEAYALLEQYDVPATVFITTGYLGRVFWWDVLAHVLFSPPELPDSLEARVGEEIITKQGSRRASLEWREALLTILYDRLSILSESRREDALRELGAWAGASRGNQNLPRALSIGELMALANSRLIELGAHTISHPLLGQHSEDQQREEIGRSKANLEKISGQPVSGFSYPHGSYTKTTRMVVRESGFRYACASHSDVTLPGTDMFTLPRFWVPDWTGRQFEFWLRQWLPWRS